MLDENQLRHIADIVAEAASEIATTQQPESLQPVLTIVTITHGQPDPYPVPMNFTDQHDKEIKMYLAGVAAGLTFPVVEAILLSTEAWMVTATVEEVEAAGGLDAFMGGLSPSQHPKRRELFIISCLTNDRRSAMIGFDIKRDGAGKIVFLVASKDHAWDLRTPQDANAPDNHLLERFFQGEASARTRSHQHAQ